LAGKLRRGSGITGLGGGAWVAPVVIGGFCGSDALICTPSRAFGAGFGIGTFCAEDGAANAVRDAAISSASAARRPRPAVRSATWNFGFLFNATSCLSIGHFIVLSAQGDMVFP